MPVGLRVPTSGELYRAEHPEEENSRALKRCDRCGHTFATVHEYKYVEIPQNGSWDKPRILRVCRARQKCAERRAR